MLWGSSSINLDRNLILFLSSPQKTSDVISISDVSDVIGQRISQFYFIEYIFICHFTQPSPSTFYEHLVVHIDLRHSAMALRLDEFSRLLILLDIDLSEGYIFGFEVIFSIDAMRANGF